MASVTGRLANLMSRYAPALGRAGTRRQIEQYRSSDGQKAIRSSDVPCSCSMSLVGPAASRNPSSCGTSRAAMISSSASPDFAAYRELTERRIPIAVLERRIS